MTFKVIPPYLKEYRYHSTKKFQYTSGLTLIYGRVIRSELVKFEEDRIYILLRHVKSVYVCMYVYIKKRKREGE